MLDLSFVVIGLGKVSSMRFLYTVWGACSPSAHANPGHGTTSVCVPHGVLHAAKSASRIDLSVRWWGLYVDYKTSKKQRLWRGGDRRLKTRPIACLGRTLEVCMLYSATNHHN